MKSFVQFMASKNGRITRIAVGIILILLGLFVSKNAIGYVLIVIGLVPLAAGIFDICLLAPLFGFPMSGPKIRAGK